MPEPLRDVILRDFQDKKMANIRIRHLGEGGEVIEFGLGDESDGTQKLFWIAGPWMDVLAKGRVLVIDELDTHLHPVLMHFLVGLMHGSGTNPQNAQCYSPHNTSLLDDDSIRRDQFWFVEKKPDNSTSVYPLTDFTAEKGGAGARLSERALRCVAHHPKRDGAWSNPINVVDCAIKRYRSDRGYDRVYCVFDRDPPRALPGGVGEDRRGASPEESSHPCDSVHSLLRILDLASLRIHDTAVRCRRRLPHATR